MLRMSLVVSVVHQLLLSAVVGLISTCSVEAGTPRWEAAKVVDVIPLAFAWTYEIETSTEIIVATKYKKPCRITLEAPLRVAADGDQIRLIDEAGREHKLRIDYRRPAKEAAPAKPTADGTSPSLPKGGQISKGMSSADVEGVLGKAKKVGQDKGVVTWTYDDVVVFFREDRVEALELKN